MTCLIKTFFSIHNSSTVAVAVAVPVPVVISELTK